MNMPVLFSVPKLLAPSKRTSHRNRVLAMARALLTFLEENQLLVRPLRTGNDVPLDLQISDTDLTEEGSKLVELGSWDWYRECDRIPIPIEAVTGMRVPTTETMPVKSLVKSLKIIRTQGIEKNGATKDVKKN
jgi:hypothetical protein